MKNLSHPQLAVLGQLSRKAYRHLQAVGCPVEEYDVWRHEVTAEVCSASSWRELSQKDYVPLCNYFRSIIGLPQRPDNTPPTEEAAMLWTIRDRLAFWRAEPAYIAAIVQSKTGRRCHGGMTWDEMMAGLTLRALRQLLYTFEARLRKRAEKKSDALGIPAPVEVHTSRSTVPPERLKDWRGDVLVTVRVRSGEVEVEAKREEVEA